MLRRDFLKSVAAALGISVVPLLTQARANQTVDSTGWQFPIVLDPGGIHCDTSTWVIYIYGDNGWEVADTGRVSWIFPQQLRLPTRK